MGKWKCENFKVKNKLFFFLHFPDFSSIRRGICTVSAQSSYFLLNFFPFFRFFLCNFTLLLRWCILCCFSCSFFLSLVSFSTFSHISSIHPRLHKRKDATCWAFFIHIHFIHTLCYVHLAVAAVVVVVGVVIVIAFAIVLSFVSFQMSIFLLNSWLSFSHRQVSSVLWFAVLMERRRDERCEKYAQRCPPNLHRGHFIYLYLVVF